MTGWSGKEKGGQADGTGETGGPFMSASAPQMSLRLEFASGSWRSYPYSDVAGIDLTGPFIKLYFYHCTVTCRGRNLKDIAKKLQLHHIGCLREKHANEYQVDEADPYFEEINIGPPNLEALARKPM